MVKKAKNMLSEVAMLVSISLSCWTARVKDEEAGQDLSEQNHAEEDVTSVFLQIVPKDELKYVKSAYSQIRITWRKYTLPWMDKGIRILPSTLFLDYNQEMKQKIDDYNKAVDNFIKRYPAIIAMASSRLGDFFSKHPLPTPSEVRNKFGVTQKFQNMPDAQDFRCDLSEEALAEIKANIESNVQASVNDAIQSIYKKMTAMLSRVSTQLKKKDPKIYETLIGNIKEYVELLPKFNINNDKNIEELRVTVEKQLSNVKTEHLKKFKKTRQETAKKADEIIKKIQGFSKL